MKYLVVTHQDLDGIFSAAIFEKYNESILIGFAEPQEIRNNKDYWIYLCKLWEKHYNGKVIFLDLPSPSKEFYNIDHHISNEYLGTKNWPGIYVEEKQSCAEIVYNLFSKEEGLKDIIEEINKIDSANFKREDFILENGIYKSDLMNFCAVIPRNSHELFRYYIIAREYLETKKFPDFIYEKARENIKKKYEVFKTIKKEFKIVGDYTIGIYYVDKEKIKNFDKMLISLEDDVDGYILIKDFEEVLFGWNVFRKEQCPINIGEFCKNFGGGGHKAIGGCNYSEVAVKTFLNLIQKSNFGNFTLQIR
jgi:oligoribonuclease NrnB/cAMP/cGMP phosphodiesterase (DHH superfamily)